MIDPPTSPDPRELWAEGERHFSARRWSEAKRAFEAVTSIAPTEPMPWLRLSTLATHQGRYRQALAYLQAAAGCPVRNAELRQLLAALLHRAGEAREALACLDAGDFAACADAGVLLAAAGLASQLEDLPRALQLLDLAERRAGPKPAISYLRGTAHLFAGALGDAEQALEAAVALDPRAAQSHWALSRVRRQTPERNHVERLRAALDRAANPAERTYLGFALVKELDDLGDYAGAWEAWRPAATAKRATLDYRPEADASAFAALQATCDAAYLRQPSVEPAPGPTPIFIVGLPRTGTTLLERMLGRCADVAIGGELDDLTLQLRWCADRYSRSHLDAGLFAAARAVDVAGVGRRYLEHVAWRASGRRFLTDKLPLNYLNIGFIHRALPQARIVHLVRHPLDAAWSNLRELFAEVYPYSYDLDDFAAYYGHYRRLMAHWHAQLPGRVLDVRYEDLVRDPEGTGRHVFAHCGLAWRDEYTATERTPGAVTTASSAQVRQAIHTRGVGHWLHYRQPLEPLRARLAAEGWLEGWE